MRRKKGKEGGRRKGGRRDKSRPAKITHELANKEQGVGDFRKGWGSSGAQRVHRRSA